jgi:hypothetical protein
MEDENGGSVDVCATYAAIKQKGSSCAYKHSKTCTNQLSRVTGQAANAGTCAPSIMARVRLIAAFKDHP